MTELLDALDIHGVVRRRVTAVAIWVSFGGAMVGLAAAQAAVEQRLALGLPGIVAILVTTWAAWTVWHSALFAWHRRAHLRHPRPYRRAFLVDIFPAITIGFSQMLRPAWNGANLTADRVWPTLPDAAGEWLLSAAGWLVAVAAFALFAAAWRTLGAAGVGFVAEFVATDGFVPVRRGPYARVRHPLFWSGVAVSFALALLSPTPTAWALASVNAAYGLCYNHLEDRRLEAVFGDRYGAYAASVPRVIPLRARVTP